MRSGDRIAQLVLIFSFLFLMCFLKVIIKIIIAPMNEVAELTGSVRGRNGFGSTGSD